MKVIPYDTHAPIEKYLEEKFKEQQLDLIFDCAGNPTIYTNSPKYMKHDGRFLSIVGGRTQGIVPTIMYRLRPVILGGTPRAFQLLAMMPGGGYARKVVDYVNGDAIKEAPIDSEYAMEDAIKVCDLAVSHFGSSSILWVVGLLPVHKLLMHLNDYLGI